MGNLQVNPQDIYHKVFGMENLKMGKRTERRRENMKRLIKDRFGTQAALAEALGKQPDYISRCLKGTKNIGDEFADEIEEKLDLPEYWLDLPDGFINLNDEERRLLHGYRKAAAGDREIMLIMADRALGTFDQRTGT